MTIYSHGDIVLVPFPFTNQAGIKRRPAVIVSSNAYNHHRPDVIIMAVTSQIRAVSHFGDIVIHKWQGAGLLKPSVIKPVLATIEKELITRKLGKMDVNDRLILNRVLWTIIGDGTGDEEKGIEE